jgi:hypothetical protein
MFAQMSAFWRDGAIAPASVEMPLRSLERRREGALLNRVMCENGSESDLVAGVRGRSPFGGIPDLEWGRKTSGYPMATVA